MNPIHFFNRNNIIFLFGLLILVMIIRWSLLAPYYVPSSSMEPTIQKGDRVLVNNSAYGFRIPFSDQILFKLKAVQKGDLVVFKSPSNPNDFLVKRIIALEGEEIPTTSSALPKNQSQEKVPEDSVFVMGDNREESLDSRQFGPVPLSYIRGQVIMVLWSVNEENKAFRQDRWAKILN